MWMTVSVRWLIYERNIIALLVLHASISAKWIMRSDWAQNSRTEALNLIRNREGNLLHNVVVTGEEMPARIVSLALGTGDTDCAYHFVLYELIETVKDVEPSDSRHIIEGIMVLAACENGLYTDFEKLVNPTGRFVIGGLLLIVA